MAVRDLFKKPYRNLDPAEVAEAVERGALLIDVREAHEWQSGHASKARHIPLSQFAGRINEMPANRQVILVCRSGVRSSRAARNLAEHHGDVANAKGGMSAWARLGLPVVATGGGPGRIV